MEIIHADTFRGFLIPQVSTRPNPGDPRWGEKQSGEIKYRSYVFGIELPKRWV